MANLAYPELAEITNDALPAASPDALLELRNKACSSSGGRFRLQSQQVFLRRVLSPDSPTRSLLVVHGTGTGKTCTAIQIAEEYILRPEYQDKKVLVLASAAVQDNFRKQIFDMSRVTVTPEGLLESKQCTGTRYLETLRRVESEPKNWNNPDTRERLTRVANRLINDFYELDAYVSFANRVNKKDRDEQWIHDTFDNRLIIVDEAHTIRAVDEATSVETSKEVSRALQTVVQTANNVVLVLLTATPMFDTFDEILFYFNLFLWNDRKQPKDKVLNVSDFFKPSGEPKEGTEFRSLCQQYVSYLRGENPFTFPFRLPPPRPLVRDEITKDFNDTDIPSEEEFHYLHKFMVSSTAQGQQLATLTRGREANTIPTLAVLPDNKPFAEVFGAGDVPGQFKYNGEPFLTPETLPNYSAKFASVLSSIEHGKGIAFVYSNYVEMGARLFAMALEEHGYMSATGNPVLVSSYKGKSKGKYLLLAGKLKQTDLAALAESKTGKTDIRVIVSSPIAAEGVDFRNVRQVHVLDPWWNMSRIEQVIGRGLRTCSHAKLPTSEQNCTVYLHVVRTGTGKECYDEYVYRTLAEPKAIKIARVRRILAESSMDCSLQLNANTLPDDWKMLEVEQIRSEGAERVAYRLKDMLAPTFDEAGDITECKLPISSEADPDHVRPLSTYTDISDELLNHVAELFLQKPIWERTQLFKALGSYSKSVVVYNLQHAIATSRVFRDPVGRPAILESKGSMYALRPTDISSGTLVERTTRPPVRGRRPLEAEKKPEKPEAVEVEEDLPKSKWAFSEQIKARFSEDILNSYVFDHSLTDDERRAYLRAYPSKLKFADRLLIPGTSIYVLGNKKFDPPEEPVGSDRDRFVEWKEALVNRFVENRDKIYGSNNQERKPTVGKVKIENEKATRSMESSKSQGPVTCGTGSISAKVVSLLIKQLDKEGKGNEEKKTTVATNCVYLDLFLREENGCVWLTPEELSILFEDPATNTKVRETLNKLYSKK